MARLSGGRLGFQLQYDPAEIPKLCAEYMESEAEGDGNMEAAGKRIAGGDFSRANLESVCRWKSARRIGLLSNNTDAEIERALKRAVAAEEVGEAVNASIPPSGVGVKMASAILTAIDPERYTVLDFRALESLGAEDSDDVDLHANYVDFGRSMAEKHGVGMRDFDRANWPWSKRRSKPGLDSDLRDS